MSRQVVRRFTSNATHLADVGSSSGAVAFGVAYRRPPADIRALCGVRINDGVIMREGAKVHCLACQYIASKEGQ